MSTKRYKAEQIVTLLRQIEVGIANGRATPQACREAQITTQTYNLPAAGRGPFGFAQDKRVHPRPPIFPFPMANNFPCVTILAYRSTPSSSTVNATCVTCSDAELMIE